LIIVVADPCKMPIGLENNVIPSGNFRASGIYSYKYGPERARLNKRNAHGRIGGWCPRLRNKQQWIAVDLGRPAKITGIATQGGHGRNYYVKTYT
jgi:hypothetical protein